MVFSWGGGECRRRLNSRRFVGCPINVPSSTFSPPVQTSNRLAAPSLSAGAIPRRIRVVDADVHHNVRAKEDLFPYLARVHRERLIEYGLPRNSGIHQANGGWRGARADTFDAGEDVDPRSNFRMFQQKLMDGCGIDLAILQVELTPSLVALADVDYSAGLIRAVNDWSLEHWVAKDPRYRLSLTVPMHDPVEAVKEIERLGDHPAVVSVYVVCGSTRLYGKREYDRVYAACVERGLSVSLHFSNEGSGMNPPPTAAGFPTYYAETYLIRPQFYQAHLSSFLFEGTFEKFPALTVVFCESGFGWVPSFRWRADMAWKELRMQTPWVKRLPSEYIEQHIRFTTQPFEETEPPGAVDQIVTWMNGARTLLYSSDFPHWDFDPPDVVPQRLAPEVRRQILAENALASYPKLARLGGILP